MSRIQPVEESDASPALRALYSTLKQKMGKLPNIFLHMGNSPQTLKGFIACADATSEGTIPNLLREQIALAVAEKNNCSYCLGAHTATGKHLGLDDKVIFSARQGSSNDPKTDAILKFSQEVVEKRGKVSNQQIAVLKSVGVTDQELVDLIGVIILNMFTNYFNLIIDTPQDFPKAPPLT